jgi:Fe-S-cluster containining protein
MSLTGQELMRFKVRADKKTTALPEEGRAPLNTPICLECGLCCNGVIFANVNLQAGDDAQRLKSLGLALHSSRRVANKGQVPTVSFLQPCSAFDGCRCRIYSERPSYCRQFECILLKKINSGAIDTATARRVIAEVRQSLEGVTKLLGSLGDHHVQKPLRERFRTLTKKLQSQPLNEQQNDSYQQLTLAMHELDCLLSQHFYR